VTPSSFLPATLSVRQQNSTWSSYHEEDAFTSEELTAMVAAYRGGDTGLVGKTKKSLQALLKFHEVSNLLL
jgi:hypothetical protein